MQVQVKRRMELAAVESFLIRQQGNGDPEALAAAYDLHSKAVYSLVFRVTRDKRATDDLVHELFVRLWNCSRRMDSLNGNLGVWLLRTARAMALAHMRALPVEIGATPAREEPAFRATLLPTLNAEQRRVLELAYFQGRSLTEIAAMLTQPVEKVKLWMSSALDHLRTGLKPQDTRCL